MAAGMLHCIDYLLHAQVDLQSVELAPVSTEELRGQQAAQMGTSGWAAGQSSGPAKPGTSAPLTPKRALAA